jgi:transcriptional regulator with XRE-family HTH domain
VDKRERTVAAQIAEEVRRARNERGWSQLALAERAGISLNYVSLIERAEQIPRVEVLLRLAGTLGTTLAALVREAPGESDADPWLGAATAILRTLPDDARPLVLGMLRGVAAVAPTSAPEASGRAKRRGPATGEAPAARGVKGRTKRAK